MFDYHEPVTMKNSLQTEKQIARFSALSSNHRRPEVISAVLTFRKPERRSESILVRFFSDFARLAALFVCANAGETVQGLAF